MTRPVPDKTPIHRARNLVSAELDGQVVLMCVASGRYYSVDPVGTRIWELLAEPRCPAQLEALLLEEFEINPEICRRDVDAFLETMLGFELIEVLTG